MADSAYLTNLKLAEAQMKAAALLDNTTAYAQLATKRELDYAVANLGAVPANNDWAQGTVLANALTTSVRSSALTLDKDYVKNGVLLRFVTTVTTTPTVTFAIQGSKDNTNWNAVYYADFSTPGTYTNATFTVTTATTIIKLVKLGESAKYLSVNVTADTNVTYTIDAQVLN